MMGDLPKQAAISRYYKRRKKKKKLIVFEEIPLILIYLLTMRIRAKRMAAF